MVDDSVENSGVLIRRETDGFKVHAPGPVGHDGLTSGVPDVEIAGHDEGIVVGGKEGFLFLPGLQEAIDSHHHINGVHVGDEMLTRINA